MRSCLPSPLLLALLLLGTNFAKADPVDDLLADQMQQHHVAGLGCMVIQNDRTIKTAYRGIANLEWNTPVAEDTVFEIGSVTKQFTAACILKLAEAGKLSLDDKISQYLPDTPPSWTNITLRHLMSHTSGIPNYDSLDGFELRLHMTKAQFVHKIGAYPLVFQPGEKWKYCNSGYNLLAYIVENVSGTNYWDFLRAQVFQPLQMTRTTRRDPDRIIPHRADGYELAKGAAVNRNYDLTDLFGAGAIVSTVPDLAKWNAALDGTSLLTEASKKQWWTPAQLNDGKKLPYGLAWFLADVQGHKNIGHSGSTSGFSAALERFPDDHLSVIILSNTDELDFAANLAKKVAALYFADAKPAATDH